MRSEAILWGTFEPSRLSKLSKTRFCGANGAGKAAMVSIIETRKLAFQHSPGRSNYPS